MSLVRFPGEQALRQNVGMGNYGRVLLGSKPVGNGQMKGADDVMLQYNLNKTSVGPMVNSKAKVTLRDSRAGAVSPAPVPTMRPLIGCW